MKRAFSWIIVAFLLLLPGHAEETCECESLTVHFFYSETCPHCVKEKAFLEALSTQCTALNVKSYLTSKEPEAWKEFSEKYAVVPRGVPMTFIGDKAFIGYSASNGTLEKDPVSGAYIGYQNQILDVIREGIGGDCLVDPAVRSTAFRPWWVFGLALLYLISYPFARRKGQQASRFWLAGFFGVLILCLFLFIVATPETAIRDYAARLPFPLFVFVIALADGFNPCAFTVLIILLSLLTYTKSRRDMLLIGIIFVLTSAIMYFIFIMVMILIGSWAFERWGTIILMVLGLVITAAGVINLKDFFFFRKGISLTISDENKSKIMKKAGRIAKALQEGRQDRRMLLFAIGATFVLAVFVNLVEFGCTAILPTVYMASLLTSFGEEIGAGHVFWTGIYALVYILPLLAILANFVYSFKSARLSESQGRVLKLVAGLFMLFFGMLMVFSPELLMFG